MKTLHSHWSPISAAAEHLLLNASMWYIETVRSLLDHRVQVLLFFFHMCLCSYDQWSIVSSPASSMVCCFCVHVYVCLCAAMIVWRSSLASSMVCCFCVHMYVCLCSYDRVEILSGFINGLLFLCSRVCMCLCAAMIVWRSSPVSSMVCCFCVHVYVSVVSVFTCLCSVVSVFTCLCAAMIV